MKSECELPLLDPSLPPAHKPPAFLVLFEMLICCYENHLVTDERNLEESAPLMKWFLWYLQGFVSLQVMNIYVWEKILI